MVLKLTIEMDGLSYTTSQTIDDIRWVNAKATKMTLLSAYYKQLLSDALKYMSTKLKDGVS